MSDEVIVIPAEIAETAELLSPSDPISFGIQSTEAIVIIDNAIVQKEEKPEEAA